jgi:hypothetical protein
MATTYHAPGVYVEEVDRGSKPIQGVGTAIAAFVGFTEHAPDPGSDPSDPHGLKPRLITNWSQFQRLYGGFAPGAMLPHAVYGYFNNGGGSCYVTRIERGRSDAGGRTGGRAAASVKSASRPELDTLRVEALGDGSAEVEITVGEPTKEDGSPAAFDLTVRRGDTVEAHKNLTFAKGSRHVEAVVNRESALVRVSIPSVAGMSVADRTPAPGTLRLAAAPAPVPVGATTSESDFAGDEGARTGIDGLVIAEDVTIVAVPDLMTAARRNGDADLALVKAVQTKLIDFGERTQTMVVLDAPPGMSHQALRDWRRDEARYDSRYAAMYYPWLEVTDPASTGKVQTISVPPSGHVAGIWARNDASRGVWKAPANEVVRGIIDVDQKITQQEQAPLNEVGINVIRPFGTRGVRVWGARTLSSDTSWRYVNVRRLFNYVERSIELGTQWVVFEPNDFDLWQRVKRTITAFLMGLWRQGALVGATPDQAFYVKCDEETNPPESVDGGKLVVEVGIAPVKPAEFVIFRISQWQGGSGEDS